MQRRSRTQGYKRRSQVGLAVILLVIAACVQGSGGMPSVVPQGTLGLAAEERGGNGAHGPLRVVHAAPRGDAAQASQVSIVFDRPLRALELAGDETPPPVRIEPPVSGAWRWVGTRALLFAGESGRLKGATRYVVEVPRGVRALDGTALEQAYRFEFTTPRPALARANPDTGGEGVTPETLIDLWFNQAIDPDALARASKLSASRAGRDRQLKFRVTRPDAAAPKHLRVQPIGGLPVHSQIQFTIADDLKGLEGELVAGKTKTISFSTYGPLAVERIECPRESPQHRCTPGGGLGLVL
jgi:hypothetical protein